MNSPDSSTSKTVEPTPPPSIAPSEGERRAIRGYIRQYGSAAATIYHGLQRGDLRWVGLADRCAGIADDALNPEFAVQMQWYTDDERTWRDISGGVMATAYCWRDGGPDGDLHGHNLEGESAVIVLTAAGRLQLVDVLGSCAQDVIARRQKKSGGQRSERIAHATRRTEPEPGDDETRMQ